jgi:DNA-binding GntR family transcriptional regulator
VITGRSDRGTPRQDDHPTLGEETTEIARIVADSAPGVERIPAAERVYAYVKAAILDRVYPGGELLTEGELADAVGVSRTPVREALLRLEAAGLVKLYPKKGALVLPVLPQEIDDVLEARELIETHAAAKVWPRRRQLVAELEPIIQRMRAHRRAGDAKAFLEADRAFHEAIVAAAGNEILTSLYLSLRDRQVRMGVAAMQVAPARMDRSIADHRELVEALAGTSAKRFRDLVANHVHNAAAHLRGTAR